MNKITYRPSQFWPLVRELQKDGTAVEIKAYGREESTCKKPQE